jgi:hypothetical protein
VKRLIDLHAARNVQQRAARPASGVQRREFIVVGVHRAKQVRLDQVAVLGNERVQAAEQHAALGPLWIKRCRNQVTVERNHPPGQFDALRQESVGDRHRGAGLQGQLKPIQPAKPNIGARPFFVVPRGHRQRFEHLPSRAALIHKPPRLVARFEKGSERGGAKSSRSRSS